VRLDEVAGRPPQISLNSFACTALRFRHSYPTWIRFSDYNVSAPEIVESRAEQLVT